MASIIVMGSCVVSCVYVCATKVSIRFQVCRIRSKRLHVIHVHVAVLRHVAS